ncbi:MAG: 5-formyltetrahydrofolate cyclo-ligase [Bacteroidales bacterium]|nr:5-formyltetrahydrofolate cyclo-ligase [Bacteroidales bacterium]
MEKSEIRRKIKQLRMMLSDIEKEQAAQEVFARLENTAAFMMADKILVYHSLPDELQTISFLKKWAGRKHFFLPRVNGVNLDLLPYVEGNLERGAFDIEEPTGSELADVDEIDLMIIPGVAFDRRRNRLGRGKGFYDRLLSTSRATKIGVGYEFQLMDEMPCEPHDVPMDIVITQYSYISGF